MELWKKIDGYDGRYEVSNFGRVRSYAKGPVRLLRQNKHKGYYVVGISCSITKKKYYKVVHRLVAEAFIENPYKKPVVDHINGDRYDNNVSNLRWATFSENSKNKNQKRIYTYSEFTDDEIKNEVWLKCCFLNKENLYVSSLGRIKYLKKFGKSGKYQKWEIKNFGSTEKSYPEFGYQNDSGQNLAIKVHLLVWKTFNGEYDSKLQVNHIDNNKHNNRLSNLNLLTASENIRHNFKTKNRKKTNFYSQETITNIVTDYYFGDLATMQLILKYRIAAEDIIEILNGTNPNVVYSDAQKKLCVSYNQFHGFKRLQSRDKNKTFRDFQKIYDLHKKGLPFSSIANQYSISPAGIKNILEKYNHYKQLTSNIEMIRNEFIKITEYDTSGY